MKRSLLILAVVLSGCTSVPIAPKFPSVPKEMLQSCNDLKPVDPGVTKLSEVLNTVVDNYGQYYDCKAMSDDWIEWYHTQKKIYESVK
jgi:hypothetical protein